MKLRNYRSESIDAAMRLAGIELGEEAVFLGSREIGVEDGQGRYEVTFALLDSNSASDPAAQAPGAAGAVEEPPTDPLRPQPQTAQKERTVNGTLTSRKGVADAPASKPKNPLSKPKKKVDRPHWKKFVPRNMDPEPSGDPQPGSSTEASPRDGPSPPIRAGEGSSSLPRGRKTRGDSANTPAAEAQQVDNIVTSTVAVTAAVSQRDSRSRDEQKPIAAASSAVQAAATRRRSSPQGLNRDPTPAPRVWERSGSVTSGAGGPQTHARPGGAGGNSTFLSRVQQELTGIRALIEAELGQRFAPPFCDPTLLRDPHLVSLLARLLESEIEFPLLDRLISTLRPGRPGRFSSDQAALELRGQIEALCQVSPELSPGEPQAQVAAFVGPCGSGKTTTVAKLAVRHGWHQQQRVHVVSADPHRVGEAEALRCYTRLAGIPLTTLDELGQIANVLTDLSRAGEDSGPEIVLIDTPGYAPSEWGKAERLARALQSGPPIDTYLVLDLTSRSRVLRRAAETYSMFQPSKLLFTKLDETTAYGGLLNESLRARLPLSFLCNGPGVPEDIAPADKARVADLILQGETEALDSHVSEAFQVS